MEVESDVTTPWQGRLHTIIFEGNINSVYEHTQLILLLDRRQDYFIYIHDKHYYFGDKQPTISRKFSTNSTKNHFFYLGMVQHQQLDYPGDPCEADPAYNFHACLKASLAAAVGCRLPWDRWTGPTVTVCTSLQQFQHYEDLFHGMEEQGSPATPACRQPCRYKEYRFVGAKQPTLFRSEHQIFGLAAKSNDTNFETEVFLYPVTSLVAEFGGTLGLFLGFSFMAIWDGFESTARFGRQFMFSIK
jgi:hypothetical protein